MCVVSPPSVSLRSPGLLGAGELPVPALLEAPPQAASATATATAPPTATNDRRLDPCIDRFSSLNRNFAANAIRSPFDEPLFERADEAPPIEAGAGSQDKPREAPVTAKGGPECGHDWLDAPR